MQVQTKRLLKVAAVGSAVAMLVAACGGSTSGDSSSSAAAGGSAAPASSAAAAAPGGAAYAGPVGEGEGQVNVLAWPGYVENGSTDPAVDWVTDFEKETGCKVNLKTFGTSDEAVKLVQGGGWDVVSASGDATLRLIYGDSVQPVNTDLVPSYADIFEDLKLQSFNSVNGVPYGIPHGRGANLIMWNTDKVTTPVDSWADTFEADSPYAGAVTAYDSPIFIADAAVYLMATQPELGITDPYALDQTQFDAAMALLTQQKDLISEYWSDLHQGDPGLQLRHDGHRHVMAGHRQPGQGRGWQGRGHQGQGRRNRLVGHVDDRQRHAEHQLCLQVGRSHRLPRDQRTGRGVVRRGAVQREVL
jgi:putative spermidine/putrescine transport system substrate-binding protein